jgi:hypothetical protein
LVTEFWQATKENKTVASGNTTYLVSSEKANWYAFNMGSLRTLKAYQKYFDNFIF